MTSNDIRQLFLKYFESKNHKVLPSFSLIPYNDATLLLINAGMAPMKPYFLGEILPPANRVTTSQKCVRVIDIERVGKTIRHLTFFEMLGNFSFGDYFKEGAIKFAWEFLTQYCKLNADKLWVSVHITDDEANKIWTEKIDIKAKKIIRLGDEHNWWAAGETGPCGPDSEIYYELTDKCTLGKTKKNNYELGITNYEDKTQDDNSKLGCLPGCDCDRFLEIWNLVFMQYNRDKEGKLTPLPKQNIDTGMGLERLTMVMQNKPSPYHTDLFAPIIEQLNYELGVKNNESIFDNPNTRVISDHLRAITFLIGDGVVPSNEGRGYVLRRLIRRVFLKSKRFGNEEPVLYKIIPTVINIFKDSHKELKENEKNIISILKDEEEKFAQTLVRGLNVLEEKLKQESMKKIVETLTKQKKNLLSGLDAFLLYDTYGFPLELTKEICEEKGIEVDEKKFTEEMEKQRERAKRADIKGNSFVINDLNVNIITQFIGYNLTVVEEEIKILLNENGEEVNELKENEKGIMIFLSTPFYAESGGQVSDEGSIYKIERLKDLKIRRLEDLKEKNNTSTVIASETKQSHSAKNQKSENGVVAQILELKKVKNTVLHFVKIINGGFAVGDKVILQVDEEKRFATARHHTATHLLQSALRQVLGSTIKQSGSLVCADYLRFDFTFNRGLKKEEIAKIEQIVQEEILKNTPTKTVETTLEEATKKGALAFFGDKYGKNVRLVEVENFSLELCGGTHTKSTGEIGILKIISEESIGAGLRRITAVCGLPALNLIQQKFNILEEVSAVLKTEPLKLSDELKKILQTIKQKDDEIKKAKNEIIKFKAEEIIKPITNYQLPITNIIKQIDGYNINELKLLADFIKQKIKNIIIILFSIENNKVNVVCSADKETVNNYKFNAGQLIKEITAVIDGSGGGRADFAQGGGSNLIKLSSAIELAKEKIQNIINV